MGGESEQEVKVLKPALVNGLRSLEITWAFGVFNERDEKVWRAKSEDPRHTPNRGNSPVRPPPPVQPAQSAPRPWTRLRKHHSRQDVRPHPQHAHTLPPPPHPHHGKESAFGSDPGSTRRSWGGQQPVDTSLKARWRSLVSEVWKEDRSRQDKKLGSRRGLGRRCRQAQVELEAAGSSQGRALAEPKESGQRRGETRTGRPHDPKPQHDEPYPGPFPAHLADSLFVLSLSR